MQVPTLRRNLELERPIDLWGTIGPLVFGQDPSWRRLRNGYAKASRTPQGIGVEVVTVSAADGVVAGEFHGPGGQWLAARLGDLLGADDDVSGFDPPPPLDATWRRRPGMRVPKTGLLFEALVPVVLSQKVTGVEAFASYRRLVRWHGRPVGFGPFPELFVPPSPAGWAAVPQWDWHRAGVGPQRARTIVGAARRADSLERLVDAPLPAARRALGSLSGIGGWTVAEVAQRALGDADAVSVGDFHVGRNVVYALTGRTDGGDAEMLALIAGFVPHRHRIQRLVEVARLAPPRRGPRYRGLDFRGR
ncbi:MAG: DNA-3-methyladenine glycosylase 2 family protein [Actinobacteria bacterium]|nr:DNA-3-methyladenine glycosylase 2 family protein [Actinomycetota bacterium]